MSFTLFSPSWFFGYDAVLELVFAIICLMIALFGIKIYKKTSQQNIKLFSIAFFLISISYFIQSIFNILTITKANEHICNVMKIQSIHLFNVLGIYTHILFMTAGLVILTFTTFKTYKEKLLWLLLTVSLIGVFVSRNSLQIFFLFSTIYLAFLSWHFIDNYRKNRKKETLLIAIAFMLLLASNMHFLFITNHGVCYAIGHILELLAYSAILWNFYLVSKK